MCLRPSVDAWSTEKSLSLAILEQFLNSQVAILTTLSRLNSWVGRGTQNPRVGIWALWNAILKHKCERIAYSFAWQTVLTQCRASVNQSTWNSSPDIYCSISCVQTCPCSQCISLGSVTDPHIQLLYLLHSCDRNYPEHHHMPSTAQIPCMLQHCKLHNTIHM